MKIIVFGAGRIGSALAFCLSRAGHKVSVIARGARLDALVYDPAIVTLDGRRAPITTLASLAPSEPCDLAIVTVPEHQVASIMAELSASQAKTILFMFNTFRGTARYASAVGSERFAFGFPNMAATLVDQQLSFQVDGPGMVTTLSRADLVTLFQDAGLPSEYEVDMDAFLRSHVAFAVPLFLAGLLMWKRSYDLTWKEARQLSGALVEGFDLVKRLGHPLKPRNIVWVARMPSLIRALLLWAFSRSALVKAVGEFGPAETRYLIDEMVAVDPKRTRLLRALRP